MILSQATAEQATRIGEPNAVALAFFFGFIAITLGITYWAARRTKTTEEFYAAGRTTSGLAAQGYSSGLSLADGTFFGRMAARHVLGLT